MSTVCNMDREKAASQVARELEGAYWGLLPAFLCWPLLVFSGRLGWPQAAMVVMASLMAGHDLADRRIPNAINILAAVMGLGLSTILGGAAGLGWSALSGVMVMAVMAVFFFMGALGGGDVKALAALATFVGPDQAALLMLLTVLAGGALALSLLLWTRRRHVGGGPKPTMPYGLAIWCGAVLLCGVRP